VQRVQQLLLGVVREKQQQEQQQQDVRRVCGVTWLGAGGAAARVQRERAAVCHWARAVETRNRRAWCVL
jgi:hypothetical protein